jgi:4-amino-4-deoxy-L-arabinose transferase-like glycosyltransferase
MTRRAWLLALAAILVRAVAALSVRVIDADSARNLQMAALFEHGRFADALRVPLPTPPLHPFLSALLNLPIRNLLVSGVAVSVLLGGLSVLPLYATARRIWDDRVATSAGLLYVFLPSLVDFHAEAMTEGTFMFFFLAALALGWRAAEERSCETTVAAALCAAFAWLTRPEGIYLLPLFALAALLRAGRFAPAAILLFAAVWIVLAFPYLAFIRAESGRWQTSLSPVVDLYRDYLHGVRHPELAAQDYEEYHVVARRGVLLGGGGHLLSNFFGKVLFYALGPFLLLGFWKPRPTEGRRALLAYGWIAAGVYLVPVALSFVISAPFSHRFLLVPAALLLPTAAAGLVRAADATRRPQALPILVGVLCLVMGIRDLRTRRADKVGVRDAGVAIRREFPPGTRVYSTARATEFYAGAEHLEDPGRADVFVFCPTELRAEGAALEARVARDHPIFGEFPSPARPGAMLVRVYAGKRSP